MNKEKNLSESDQLDEALPLNFWDKLYHGARSKLGSVASNASSFSKGKLEAGKVANKLMNDYKLALGRANSKPTLGTLIRYLEKFGYSGEAVKKSLEGVLIPGDLSESGTLKYYLEILNEDSSYNQELTDKQVAQAIMAAVADWQARREFGTAPMPNSPEQAPTQTSTTASPSPASSTTSTTASPSPASSTTSTTASPSPASSTTSTTSPTSGDAVHMRWLLDMLKRSDTSAFNAAISSLKDK